MQPATPGLARPKKRLPNWLKIVLAVFAVLFVLGAVFGKSAGKTTSAGGSVSTAPVTTNTTPAEVTYTVAGVTDAATLDVTGSDGSRKTVRVLGVVAPAANNGCYGAESLGWASVELVGKTVKLGAVTARGVNVTLPIGTDYATQALQLGYVKYAADAGVSALQAAESLAHQANTGLWGPPCNGVIDAPAPATTAPPAPAPADTKTAPEPPPVQMTEEQPAPQTNPAVYYRTCADARAAGAAPLYRGEPGYRPALDRDGDGVACEK